MNERILPPIAFSEGEAISIFFSIHSLRHYVSLPFNTEYESIKKKFYLNLSGETRDVINTMKNRVDFLSVYEYKETPFLMQLLNASIHQKVIIINYETTDKSSKRSIQPIGIYANEGKWYCPSYCFLTKDYRVFRCDRIKSVEFDEGATPIDLSNINLNNAGSSLNRDNETYELYVELTHKGIEKYKPTQWLNIELSKREDGTGFMKGNMSKRDIDFFSDYFISFGKNAIVKQPFELIEHIKEKLNLILNQYD